MTGVQTCALPICPDNYGWSFDPEGVSSIFEAAGSRTYVDGVLNANPWEKYTEIAKDCSWSVTVNWYGEKQVSLTYEFVSETKGTYTCVYEFTLKSIPENGLGVHLCGENCYYTIDSYTIVK